MPERISKELVSLIHHVALNESGWWGNAVKKIIIAIIWQADRPISFTSIRTLLRDEYSINLTAEQLNRYVSALRSDKSIVESGGSGEFIISQPLIDELERNLKASIQSGEAAKRSFIGYIETNCDVHEGERVWNEFNENFLFPLIQDLGARVYRLISGGSDSERSVYIDEFIKRYDPEVGECIRDALVEFFKPNNLSARSYVLSHLNSVFVVKASSIPGDALELIQKSQEKKPNINLFLDTNYLFSVLDLHVNPSDDAAYGLAQLVDELKEVVNLKLYVIEDTVEEARRVLAAAAHNLSTHPIPGNVATVALRHRISGIAAKYLENSLKSGCALTPDEYFAPYITDIVRVMKSKGVEVFGRSTAGYHTRQSVIDDVHDYHDHEEATRPENPKSYDAIQHDMTLWHFAKDCRPSYVTSPLDSEYWIVTLDYRLLGFDQYKQRRGNVATPACLHPATLIQLLQFWMPMNDDVESSLIESLRLPMISSQFDHANEEITLKIIKTISRYEDSGDLSESAVRDILVNQALRARLSEDLSESKEIEYVREALIEQQAALEKKLEQASVKLREEHSKVKDKDQAIDELKLEVGKHGEVIEQLKAQLEESLRRHEKLEDGIDEKDDQLKTYKAVQSFKSSAITLPLILLLFINLIVVLSYKEIDFLNQLSVLIINVILLAIWVIWIVRQGDQLIPSQSLKIYVICKNLKKYMYLVIAICVSVYITGYAENCFDVSCISHFIDGLAPDTTR